MILFFFFFFTWSSLSQKAAKYDVELANEAFAWINEMFEYAGGEPVLPGSPSAEQVVEALKDGLILCK